MKKIIPRLALVAPFALAFATNVHADDGEENGWTIANANKLSFGTAMRVQERDSGIVGTGNGGRSFSTNHDDGNLAFDDGDAIFAITKLTSDLTVSKNGYGVFLRGSLFYDPVLNRHDYFNPSNYGAGKSAPSTEFERRTRDARNYLGRNGRLLDAYVFGAAPIAGRSVSFKLGNQVVNWGESTLITNGINSIIPADANKLRVPGFELNEVLTPVPMLWFGSSLWGNFSFEAFYQLQWKKTQPDVVGSYFSTQDYAGVGATRANLGFGQAPENTPNTTVPRAADVEPKNSGQFGVKLETVIPQLNEMGLSLYAMQYHSRLPLLSGTSKPAFASPSETANYFIEYPENIRLYGLSFNGAAPFGFAIQGEYSYKQGQPLQIDDVELLLTGVGVPSQIDPVLGDALGGKYIRGWRRHNVSQVDINVTRLVGPLSWLHNDQILFLAEVADMYVHTLPPESQLRYEGPATDTPGDCVLSGAACTGPVTQNNGGYATRNSWGYRLLARLTYNNVFSGVTLEPTILWSQDVSGISPTPVANFIGGVKSVRPSLAVRYLESLTGELAYTSFFGAGERNYMNDRDYVELNLKYSF